MTTMIYLPTYLSPSLPLFQTFAPPRSCRKGIPRYPSTHPESINFPSPPQIYTSSSNVVPTRNLTGPGTPESGACIGGLFSGVERGVGRRDKTGSVRVQQFSFLSPTLPYRPPPYPSIQCLSNIVPVSILSPSLVCISVSVERAVRVRAGINLVLF